jgi:hypothetical protein
MRFLLIAAFAGLLLFSCNKTNSPGKGMITGKWELRQSTGGIAGTINYASGNGMAIVFDNNKQYQYIYPAADSVSPRSGTYEIKGSAHSGDWLLQLQYVVDNQAYKEKDSIRFEANKLIFISTAPYVDMPTFSYERLSY